MILMLMIYLEVCAHIIIRPDVLKFIQVYRRLRKRLPVQPLFLSPTQSAHLKCVYLIVDSIINAPIRIPCRKKM